jgi:hypothetical protein
MGWWRFIALHSFYFERMFVLQKGIHDRNSVDGPSMLHVLGEDLAATGLFSRSKYHRVPKGDAMKAVKVDASKNVLGGWLNDTESRQKLNLETGNFEV